MSKIWNFSETVCKHGVYGNATLVLESLIQGLQMRKFM